MFSHVAYLLVFHGSHDLRSQQAAQALTQAFRQAIQQIPNVPQAVGQTFDWRSTEPLAPLNNQPGLIATSLVAQDNPILVQDAYLECFPLPLHQQITQFAQQVEARSGNQPLQKIVVIPVFLLAGTHVMEDIPSEVALAQPLIGNTILEITPHFGAHAGLQRVITEQMAARPFEAWILLAHGSRYPGANQNIEAIANKLGAIAAYWSTEPKLETRLQELATAGLHRIGIFPYFLFSGAITDAIAQNVTQLSQQWPQLALTLVTPLEGSQELANLLVDSVPKS